MILDKALLFDTAAAVTGATGTYSVNQVDLVNARDIGIGDGSGMTPKILVLVTTAFLTTDSATLNIAAEGSTDATTWTTYAESGILAASVLAIQGKEFPIGWPHRSSGAAMPQYLRLNYIIGTGHFTVGSVTSAIVLGRDDIPAYPPGITVAN